MASLGDLTKWRNTYARIAKKTMTRKNKERPLLWKKNILIYKTRVTKKYGIYVRTDKLIKQKMQIPSGNSYNDKGDI